jgi:large conductance mechanosensitive channel
MLKDFKKFILRGNVVDLAVAVVIGAAFNSVVQSLVRDFITPLITGISGSGQLVRGTWTIAHRFVLNWGDFLNALISFLIIAAVVFFFVVQPLNKLVSYSHRARETDEEATKKCPECLSEIPAKAKRCAFCTSHVGWGD